MRCSFDRVSYGDRLSVTEDAFHYIISLERRRVERSQETFLLMLLDVNLLVSVHSAKKMNKFLSAILDCTRETDVAGWYRRESVLGIILTDISPEVDRSAIMAALVTRISSTLRHHVTEAEYMQLSNLCSFLPEERAHLRHQPNLSIYPFNARENATPLT